MPVKSFESISNDIINTILTTVPDCDVSVGEAVRDVFIDVQASQLEVLYGIANNTAQAMSVNTALNTQLDRLGKNFNQQRNDPTKSATTLTISIKQGLSVPTPLNVGDQYYTESDQNNGIVTFLNTEYQLLQPGQTQATTAIISAGTGSNQNVAAYTITKSSYDFADAVYNIQAATGGADKETDAAYALRLPFVITGQYINVTRGILSAVLNIADINGTPFYVTPDNPLSRGQYTLDAYMQRSSQYFGTTISEVVPANTQNYSFKKQPLYELNPINEITIYNPADNTTQIAPSSSYQIINDPADVAQFYSGSIFANQQLQWLTQPPANPYTISYNYDHTIIDAQAAFDVHNELVSDTLYRQAHAIPVYVSANLTVVPGTNLVATSNNAISNLNTLFDSLSTTQPLSDDETKFAFLNDHNVLTADLKNLDTTYEVILTPGTTSGFLTPSAQSTIAPLGYYFEIDATTSLSYYSIVARLYIGKPDVIVAGNQSATTAFNFKTSNTLGITSQDVVNSITPSWNTQILPTYDSANDLLLLSFTALPSSTDTLTLRFVQDNISTTNLSYLTLAPALVSPVNPYNTNIQLANPEYATRLPDGINSIAEATMYKNGVSINPSTPTSIGDYTILAGPNPDTGVINVQFTTPPASTDIFQFGKLNPDLNISYSSSGFTRN